jgi:aryl-alcohol dehydrogenase-like predicted oxidoreductase
MKLALGTVQFGLDYGISNSSGKTTIEDAVLILNMAKNAGIDTVDTASAYGDSEEVLGSIGIGGWNVVSKIPSLPKNAVNGREWVLNNLRQSLEKLRVERLDGLLLHNAMDLLSDEGRNIALGMQDAKAAGLVVNVGYSIYSPNILGNLIKIMPPDLVQAPYNVLDQRFSISGWLSRLAGEGVEIHIRSAFMQGLLLMNAHDRPQAFKKWNNIFRRWDYFTKDSSEQAVSLCLGFLKGCPDISRIVVGVDSVSHLEQILGIWSKAAPFDAIGLACDDPLLVEPSNW